MKERIWGPAISIRDTDNPDEGFKVGTIGGNVEDVDKVFIEQPIEESRSDHYGSGSVTEHTFKDEMVVCDVEHTEKFDETTIRCNKTKGED